MLLLKSISDLTKSRKEEGRYTTLRKIKAHTHIPGNDLLDAAAKLAVTDFDTLPPEQTIRVEVGAIAPRPPFWVMYTTKPKTPPPAQATCPRQVTLRSPWWTIPKEERLQMQAFARRSQQLRHKVRATTLRSLHQASLYMRLILLAKEKGAYRAETGKALHIRLVENPAVGTYLLKFAYCQF